MPEKLAGPEATSNSNGFWSSPWTIAVATTILGAFLAPLVSLAFQSPAPLLAILKIVGLAVLTLAAIVIFGLAQENLFLARLVGAIYGYIIGSIIGGLIQDYAQPSFPISAPYPSISLLHPPGGRGFVFWIAWAAPIIGAFVGAHINGRKLS